MNIYKNYYEKVKIRIGNDKTTINKFGIKNFNKLSKLLIDYEKSKKVIFGLIHGDPVLSNIIKNNEDLVS